MCHNQLKIIVFVVIFKLKKFWPEKKFIQGLKNLVKIGLVTAEIFLIWANVVRTNVAKTNVTRANVIRTNVDRTNVAWTNITVTFGIC